MKVEVRELTSWKDVLNNARFTMGKDNVPDAPSIDWCRRMMMCRHSPIEALEFEITLTDIPSFVSVHLVRHKIGITHWVKSQRTDRTGEDRNGKRQDAPVNHRMKINAQAIVAVSKKRLCGQASPETRAVWSAVRDEMVKVDPVVASFMRPECWWCGDRCPEMKPCGKCKPKGLPPFKLEGWADE